jgi:hypothetical protein
MTNLHGNDLGNQSYHIPSAAANVRLARSSPNEVSLQNQSIFSEQRSSPSPFVFTTPPEESYALQQRILGTSEGDLSQRTGPQRIAATTEFPHTETAHDIPAGVVAADISGASLSTPRNDDCLIWDDGFDHDYWSWSRVG